MCCLILAVSAVSLGPGERRSSVISPSTGLTDDTVTYFSPERMSVKSTSGFIAALMDYNPQTQTSCQVGLRWPCFLSSTRTRLMAASCSSTLSTIFYLLPYRMTTSCGKNYNVLVQVCLYQHSSTNTALLLHKNKCRKGTDGWREMSHKAWWVSMKSTHQQWCVLLLCKYLVLYVFM